MSDVYAQARLLMEAIAILHTRDYGLLKLFSYVKNGVGAWRHWIFASAVFPYNIWDWPGATAHGSLPGLAFCEGSTAEDVAESIKSYAPDLMEAARGNHRIYVDWYRNVLQTYPHGILIMESPKRAEILGRGVIQTPPLQGWRITPPTPEEAQAREETAKQKLMEIARRKHNHRHRKRK